MKNILNIINMIPGPILGVLIFMTLVFFSDLIKRRKEVEMKEGEYIVSYSPLLR